MTTEAEDAPDNLSRQGAIEMALRLDAFWHARGHRTVRHWVVPAQIAADTARKVWGLSHGAVNRAAIWTVRSNLVRGQPPPRFHVVAMPDGAFRPQEGRK
jgi:hypothetical protein